MNIIFILLRLIHIGSGVFWAGAAIMLAGFLEPLQKKSSPEGARFMQRLYQGPFPVVLGIAGPLNLLSGLTMYWLDSGGLQRVWVETYAGLTFAIGGILAMAAYLITMFVNRPVAQALRTRGKEMQGGSPNKMQTQRLHALQERLTRATVFVATFLGLAALAMAVARYL